MADLQSLEAPNLPPSEDGVNRSRAALIPLVVGVTGHRDLNPDQISDVRKKVADILRDLRTEYAPTPIVLLSALAEGADRLVADVALELGLMLVVPLPYQRTAYIDSFREAKSAEAFKDSVHEFNHLLERAHSVFTLPATDPKANPTNPKFQNEQYEALGAYIVTHAQVLIALWDGKPSEKQGGTSRVIHFQISGVPKELQGTWDPLEPIESGPVQWVKVARKNDAAGPVTVEFLHHRGFRSKEEAIKSYRRISTQLKHYNECVLELGTDLVTAAIKGQEDMVPGSTYSDLGRTGQTLLWYYAVTDALANIYRNRTQNALAWLCGLGIVAAITLIVFLHPVPWPPLLLLYLLLVTTGFLWSKRAERGHFKGRHLDYRALAEGLRVQFFWHVAGLREPVADHYLGKQRGVLDWIRNAMRAASVMTHKRDPDPEEESHPSIALGRWVEREGEWFTNKAQQLGASHETMERWSRRALRVAVGLTILTLAGIAWMLFVSLRMNPFTMTLDEWPQQLGNYKGATKSLFEWMIAALSAGFAISAILDWYDKRRALGELAKQYLYMSSLMQLAGSRISEALDRGAHDEAKTLFFELGKQALAENGDWVMLHRDRPVEQPFAS